mgnify:CR=1 FL=1
MPTTARILAVCTGNICRSPAVERLLAARLGPGYAVASAGTRALVGSPIDTQIVRLLGAAHVSAAGFSARQLTSDLVREADLVLTLKREHRSAVVRLAPAALRTTFTLRELGRLLTVADLAHLPTDPQARVAELAARARAARADASARPATPEDDDVVDPYGGDGPMFLRAWEELVPPVTTLVGALRGGLGDPSVSLTA